MLSPKQSQILREIEVQGKISLNRAVELVGDQYHNQRFYTSQILRNMVKRGAIQKQGNGRKAVWIYGGTPVRNARVEPVLPSMKQWAIDHGLLKEIPPAE